MSTPSWQASNQPNSGELSYRWVTNDNGPSPPWTRRHSPHERRSGAKTVRTDEYSSGVSGSAIGVVAGDRSANNRPFRIGCERWTPALLASRRYDLGYRRCNSFSSHLESVVSTADMLRTPFIPTTYEKGPAQYNSVRTFARSSVARVIRIVGRLTLILSLQI